MPMSEHWSEQDRHYCDLHINRGCSCNFDYETNEESLDELGQLYPCIEYDFSVNGFYSDSEGSWILHYEDWAPFIEDYNLVFE